MPLNITVHNPLQLRNGVMPQAPLLDLNVVAQVVALGAQSTPVINGPCLVCLIADEDQRITPVTSGVYAAPSAAGIKLKAGVERYFELPKGTWFFNVAAG